MNPNIERLKLVFIGLFALMVVGVVVWQVHWEHPRRVCEVEQHKWWDPGERICATPVLISDITRRTIQDKQAEAAARAAIGRAAPPAP